MLQGENGVGPLKCRGILYRYMSCSAQSPHDTNILFLLYINDIEDVVNHSHVKIFADDSKLHKLIKSLTDRLLLQEDLDMAVFDDIFYIVDIEQEQKRAQHRPLWYAAKDCNSVRVTSLNDHELISPGQERFDPVVQAAADAVRSKFLEENLVIYFIEGLGEIEVDDVSVSIGGEII